MIKIYRRNKGQKCLFKKGDKIMITDVEIPLGHQWLIGGYWYIEKVVFDEGIEKIRIGGQDYPAYYFVKVEI